MKYTKNEARIKLTFWQRIKLLFGANLQVITGSRCKSFEAELRLNGIKIWGIWKDGKD